VAEADLASTVTFPASVNAGQPVSGTVKYTNNGPSSASGVTFGLTLSPNCRGADVDAVCRRALPTATTPAPAS
jgi:uncharacterized repeat protein (TIGR01451 family)